MIKFNYTSDWLTAIAQSNGNNSALLFGNDEINYFQLDKGVQETINHFHSLNLTGERIGVLINQSPQFVYSLFALWRMGKTAVLINPNFTEDEIIQHANTAMLNEIIVDKSFNKIFGGLKFHPHSFSNDESFYKNEISLDDTAVIIFTSGSSGKPKAVELSFNNLLNSVVNLDEYINLNENETWLASLPFYHVGGFLILIRSLLSAATAIIPDDLSNRGIADSFIKYNPTYTSLVSRSLKYFHSENIKSNKNNKSVFLGGGPVDKSLIHEMLDKDFPLHLVYGSTETSSMVTCCSPSEIKANPNSAGRPLPNVGITLNKNRIVIQSASIAKGYFNNVIETQKYFPDKNIFLTNDFGVLDEDNHLFVHGRIDDVIISGGKNINVNEVKSAIDNLLENDCSYVCGIDDDDWGTKLIAFIQKDYFTLKNKNEIFTELKKTLSSYKIPKNIYLVKSFPKTELGKIKRAELLAKLSSNEFQEIL